MVKEGAALAHPVEMGRNGAVMKLAVFTDTFGQINGVAITIDELVGYARDRGIALDVYTHVTGMDSIEKLGSVRILRFRMLAPVRINEGLSFDLRLLNRRILTRMREERYDLVHFEAHGTMGIAARVFSRRLGIPVVGSYNTDLPSYIAPFVEGALPWLDRGLARRIAGIGERAAWAATRRLFGNCDLVLAPSEHTRLALERRLGRPVALFPRGVDVSVFTPEARAGSGRAGGARPTALYVGRFSSEKNLGALVEMFRGRTDVSLRLVGSGPTLEAVLRQLPGAEYLGVIREREDLARVFAAADIFVMPSETETFGQVIVEAAACGLPAIVSSAGASRENILDGVSGFAAGSPRQFVEALDRLVADPALRRDMGLQARLFGLSRSWEKVFDGLFARYDSLLADR